MTITAETRIGDIALEFPEAMRLFEQRNLDYCCGGQRRLAEVCREASQDLEELLDRLASLQTASGAGPARTDWAGAPLSELVSYIEAKHHTFTREELTRVAPLMEKVLQVHGGHHPELEQVSECFQALAADLMPHLEKEEQILFPYIRALDTRQTVGGACFGSVRGPIQVMQAEHDQAGELLREIKALTRDHTPPPDACGSFRSLYMGLKALEEDLHQHIHLENNVLFPRAVALEASRISG